MEGIKNKLHDRELLLRQICLLLLDALATFAAGMFGLLLRFDLDFTKIQEPYFDQMWMTLVPNIITVLVVYWLFRLYHSVWRSAGYYEIQMIFLAGAVATLLQLLGMTLLGMKMPRSYWFLYFAVLVILTVATRFTYRVLRRVRKNAIDRKRGVKPVRVMIVGGGAAAETLLREINTSSHISMKAVCIIDDDCSLWGRSMQGVPIVGGRDVIVDAADKYQVDEIFIAMPSVAKRTVAEVAKICNETGCVLKTLPGIYQLMNDEVRISKLRHVDIEDLLGREPVMTDLAAITGYIEDQVVLVTGGGGSIGSELCRQIAAAGPKQLVIVDIYENNAYEIQQELKRKYPKLNLVVLIASVRNTNRMDSIFETYLPNIVFHAAAHKHVPLMEDSPNEAIKNNVFGTLKTAQAADKYGVERFVLISTDKAVNPTNIMGASKRICEMIVQAYNRRSQTEYVAVRFGNVLGSNGSVIPLFKQQIREGGPVTVTHPDIIRYFMTIPEAVSLVLEAGATAKGGEIFVLDMGEPVKIVDLAKNLIKLSGYIPNEDIMIEYTGLRPGEKLYEERLMAEEGLQKTSNDRISVAQPLVMKDEEFFESLAVLKDAVYEETGEVREMVKEIVPTYKRPEGK